MEGISPILVMEPMTAHVSTVVACDTVSIAVAGLRFLLDGGNEFRLVAGETSLADGTEAVRIYSPAVLIVDKAFGIHPVMEWMREIRADVQKTQVVVWASNLNETESLRFLQAGA